jgi:hypothetical protein
VSQTPSSATPNPAVAAFFRSTRWKLLFAADAVTVFGGAIGYYLTNNVLAFAPFAVVAVILGLTLYRVAKRGAAPAPVTGGDDPIVR